MNWSAEDIKSNYICIMTDSKILTKSQLEKKYEVFIKDNEKLYLHAIDSAVKGQETKSIKMLVNMLNLRHSVNKGYIDKSQADMMVGNRLAHEYIFPITGVPSKEDYLTAIKKIQQDENANAHEKTKI